MIDPISLCIIGKVAGTLLAKKTAAKVAVTHLAHAGAVHAAAASTTGAASWVSAHATLIAAITGGAVVGALMMRFARGCAEAVDRGYMTEGQARVLFSRVKEQPVGKQREAVREMEGLLEKYA